MAIIRCKKCGEEVSDLGFKCIHCGHILLKHEFFDTDYFQAIRCPRCGNYILTAGYAGSDNYEFVKTQSDIRAELQCIRNKVREIYGK